MSIDVEDLEVDATPEDLMLSYVSGEKGKVGRARAPSSSTPFVATQWANAAPALLCMR